MREGFLPLPLIFLLDSLVRWELLMMAFVIDAAGCSSGEISMNCAIHQPGQ
jgi:hypothetical protein